MYDEDVEFEFRDDEQELLEAMADREFLEAMQAMTTTT